MNKSRWLGAPLCALLVACTAVQEPTSPPSDAPRANGQPIVIGLPLPPFASTPFIVISNAYPFRPPIRGDIVTQLVYNGLYRYDDSFSPVPDLADGPCAIADDQVTITCRIVEAKFHNGSNLTADDVAFTYELARRQRPPECLFGFGLCVGEMLQSATAVDERTIEFRLSAPNATFLTEALPSVFIDSRAVVEAAYAGLGERASTLNAADYRAAAEAIYAQLDSDGPDCEAPLARAEELLTAAALEPLPREQFNGPDGQFDACLYAQETAVRLEDVAASLGATGLDAIARVYRALSFNRSPIGTGPWRFVRVEDGTRAILEAFDGYFRGPPATPRIEVRVIRDPTVAREGMRSGELTWVFLPPALYEQVKSEGNLQFAAFPDQGIFTLAYNLREGMLFADRALREAVELCIDKPQTVDAATNGTGDVIYSPIEPVSWAYQPDLPRPARDVGGARGLIEAAGWAAGTDGIYERAGTRLATDVYVRGDEAQRVAFMDLIAEQVRDCGIEFNVIPVDVDTALSWLAEYPHIPTGYEEPFEAVFVGFTGGYDPDDSGRLFRSSLVSSPEQPDGENFIGFSNERVDELLDAGVRTYDQRERARIYREFQQLLAQEHAVLFAWANRRHEALDSRLTLTDGQLNLSSGLWWWELEKLILPTSP